MSLGRILTAMVTPMNEALEVDYQEAIRLAQHLIAHGSDGVVERRENLQRLRIRKK